MIPRNLFVIVQRRNIGVVTLCNKLHTAPFQYHQSYVLKNDEHVKDSSLWTTVLPKKSLTAMIRSGKRKPKGKKPVQMLTGPLVVSCKNEKLNHYRGMHYNKLTPVPLASKGWHSKKANGDYFSILPIRNNPSFLLPHNFSVDRIFEEDNREECDPDEFKALGVSDELIERLKNTGIHYPTGIQLAVIPKLLSGKNLIINGETGCGKTLSYVIPILEHIAKYKSKISCKFNSPLALIIVPSRELALQVGKVVSGLVEGTDITCKVVLANYTKRFLENFDENDLEKVDVAVSTLGVMCKYSFHQVYTFTQCLHVVLDEADTLLDDSFSHKLQTLLRRCRFRLSKTAGDEVPEGAQLSLVSATIPKELEETLENILPAGALERVETEYLHKIPPHIKQNFIRCKKSAKPENLLNLVKKEIQNDRSVIIFSNKTETCNWLAHFLRGENIECSRLHSKMHIEERVTELEKFREGAVKVITCTDIASRGQDIPRISHVVNYEFPVYMADYVHRCGRTGRIGNDGKCEVTSFISKINEVPLLNDIELSARTGTQLKRVNNNIKRMIYKKYESRLSANSTKK